MTLKFRRRPFLHRLTYSPQTFIRNYRVFRAYGTRRDALRMALVSTWILLRPLVDEAHCWVCHDGLFPPERRVCQRCEVWVVAAMVVTGYVMICVGLVLLRGNGSGQ